MIRLYGQQVGESSFVQVTRGVERALRANGAFAGLVPLDGCNDYESYDGADAPISVNTGNPFGSVQAAAVGTHQQRWLLLAPNSEQMPPAFVRRLTQKDPTIGQPFTGLLGPSTWACGVLKSCFKGFPVLLAPHGVNPEIHHESPGMRESVRRDYAAGAFRVLHMTSSGGQRKGTRLLLKAWASLKKQKQIPEASCMSIVAEPQYCTDIEFWCEGEQLVTEKDVAIRPGLGLSQHGIASLYSYSHVLAQPSRAEGFGLVPLESRACGVPIVVTDCTGHAEHVGVGTPGALVIPTGKSAPLDDFDNSTAPSLRWEDIAYVLRAAYDGWSHLDNEASSNAGNVQKHWAWEAVMKPCIERMREGEKHVR